MAALSFLRHRGMQIVLIAVVSVVTLWAFSGVFTSEAARECARLYRAARTAADTTTVEATVPKGTYSTPEPRSCGSLRSAARWFVIR